MSNKTSPVKSPVDHFEEELVLVLKVLLKSSFNPIAQINMISIALMFSETSIFQGHRLGKGSHGQVGHTVEFLGLIKLEMLFAYVRLDVQKAFDFPQLHPWLLGKLVTVDEMEARQVEVLQPSCHVNVVNASSHHSYLTKRVVLVVDNQIVLL